MTTIILLEDDAELREFLSLHLEAHGYQVVAQSDSHSIADLVKKNDASCVITDLVMPEHEGMEGIFLAKQIPGLKIIAMSASAAYLRIAENLVDRCMTKPFSANELLAAVEAVLASD